MLYIPTMSDSNHQYPVPNKSIGICVTMEERKFEATHRMIITAVVPIVRRSMRRLESVVSENDWVWSGSVPVVDHMCPGWDRTGVAVVVSVTSHHCPRDHFLCTVNDSLDWTLDGGYYYYYYY